MNIRVLLATFCLGAALAAVAQTPRAPASRDDNRAPARLASPVVHPDRTITFQVRAPEARRVALAGFHLTEVLQGRYDPIPMARGEDGIWRLTVGPVPPDIYDYRLDIDGVAMADTANNEVSRGTNGPVSQVIVPGDGPMYYDPQPGAHGTVHRVTYHAAALGGFRELHVYVPPGYDDDPGRRYPVLYLLHGIGEMAHSWTQLGRAHHIMDNLLREGRARPMLIVMPYGHAVDRWSPEGRGRNTELFSRTLLDDVVPLIESRYRTLPGREHRALAGLSMGGGQTFAIGLAHPDRFASLGIFSAALVGREAGPQSELLREFTSDPAATNARMRLVFIGCGESDRLLDGSRRVRDTLAAAGVRHVYHEMPGGHSWSVWRHLLYHGFLPRLWQP